MADELPAARRRRAAHRPPAVGRDVHADRDRPVADLPRPARAADGGDRRRDRLRLLHRRARQVRDRGQQLLLPAGRRADLPDLRRSLLAHARVAARSARRARRGGERRRPARRGDPARPRRARAAPSARAARARRSGRPAGRPAALALPAAAGAAAGRARGRRPRRGRRARARHPLRRLAGLRQLRHVAAGHLGAALDRRRARARVLDRSSTWAALTPATSPIASRTSSS